MMQILTETNQTFQELQKHTPKPKLRWQKRLMVRLNNGKRLSNRELKAFQRWLREVQR